MRIIIVTSIITTEEVEYMLAVEANIGVEVIMLKTLMITIEVRIVMNLILS